MKLSILMPWMNTGDPWRNAAFEWVTQRYRRLFPDSELVLGSCEHEFNISEARNNAYHESTGDVVLVADADTFCPAEQIWGALIALETGAPWVIPYGEHRYYNLSEVETYRVLDLPPDDDIPEPFDPEQWEHKITSYSGLVVVPKDTWEKVGGFDEEFRGWGWEDRAFQVSADRKVGLHRRIPGHVQHLWHPAPVEHRFGQPNIRRNQARYEKYEQGLL